MSRTRSRLAAWAAAAFALSTLAACGSDDAEPSAGAGEAVSAERCERNEAAGTITYMTGYFWQASASIMEVMAAEELGYFDALCLDVELQPGQGDVSQNAKLLASGQIQLGGLSQQDVITANANGLEVVGISSYSDAGLDVLMTMPEITDLAQLRGRTLGHKGWVPMGVSAMLAEAGLDPAADVEQVKVGYDPTVLSRGQVDALVGFVSNEPNQLEAAGETVTVWEPADFGVPGSIGSFAANPAFAEEHPTAVEDFLRAAFRAFQHCAEDAHVEECIDIQGEYAGAESDPEHETAVWNTEAQVVADNPLPGKWGSVDEDNVRALADLISQYADAQVTPDQAVGFFDGSFADAVVDDAGEVVWPAP